MAFRIMKVYPDGTKFAAKIVRYYGDLHVLPLSTTYTGIEKIADYIPPPPTPQDKADIKELEKKANLPSNEPDAQASPIPPGPKAEVLPHDPELDQPPTPPTQPELSEDETQDAHLATVVQETKQLDKHRHWLTAQAGFFVNANPSTVTSGNIGLAYSIGGGIRYGISAVKQLFLKRPGLQDSLTPEVGVFIYKIMGNSGDTYTILPTLATLRYNFQIGERLAIFIYGGALFNFLIDRSNPVDTVANTLSFSIFPAAGAGLIFQIGPSWDVRFDAGFDSFGLGLMLRF
jgi:hypothetical protein